MTDTISMRILGLNFKSDNNIKSQAIKYIATKIMSHYDYKLFDFTSYKNNENGLSHS